MAELRISYAKVVAIAGASGYVGKAFTDALLEANAFEIRILARESSIENVSLQDFKKRGAALHVVSYEDEASIVKALQGVEVVIATVAGSALAPVQLPLIKAAKTAGVKTYFPSEYGSFFKDDSPSPVVQAKRTVLAAAKEIGLPVTAICNGVFPEYCFIPQIANLNIKRADMSYISPLGYDFAGKKITVWGDGNSKITWTTARSVAQWISNVLKTIPIEQLQNKYFNIQGDSFSPNEIAKLWERKHNDNLEIDRRPFQELVDRVKADKNDILAVVLEEWHSGRCELEPLNNDLFPGWKPETVESIL